MEWVAGLYGQVVGTSPLIYYIQQHPRYQDATRAFFQAVDRGDLRLVASVVTLLEVLVQPLRAKNASLAGRYREILLNSPNVNAVSLSPEIAEEAARLRADYRLRTPDAIQLATAVLSGASCFVTNDASLPNSQI